jgi:hypothetical protein
MNGRLMSTWCLAACLVTGCFERLDPDSVCPPLLPECAHADEDGDGVPNASDDFPLDPACALAGNDHCGACGAACRLGTVCRDGECLEGCRGDNECFGGFCQAARCVECRGAADCSGRAACVDFVCSERCREDSECPEGTICEEEACVDGCRSVEGSATTWECADENECTRDECVGHVCVQSPEREGEDCLVSQCSSGTCIDGACVTEPANEGVECRPDGSFHGACYSSRCAGGECVVTIENEGLPCEQPEIYLQYFPEEVCRKYRCHEGDCVLRPLAQGTLVPQRDAGCDESYCGTGGEVVERYAPTTKVCDLGAHGHYVEFEGCYQERCAGNGYCGRVAEERSCRCNACSLADGQCRLVDDLEEWEFPQAICLGCTFLQYNERCYDYSHSGRCCHSTRADAEYPFWCNIQSLHDDCQQE